MNIYNIIAFGFAIWLTVAFIARLAQFLAEAIVDKRAKFSSVHGILVLIAWVVWYVTLVAK